MQSTASNRSIGSTISHLLSWILHPVFLPVWLIAFLLFGDTSTLFLGFDRSQRFLILAQAFTLYSFFPMVTVGLLKALGFLESIRLQTQRERIIPLVASGIWYFWIWYVWKNLPEMPMALVRFALATWTVSWITLMVNVRMKISLHTTAAGLVLVFLIGWAMEHTLSAGIYLPIACLLAGTIGAARLKVSDHQVAEVYAGYVLGGGTMFLVQIVY